ncbi:MAG: ferredoxin family protein [Betaproteobacteria bacterium]
MVGESAVSEPTVEQKTFTAKIYKLLRGRWIVFPELCKGCGLCVETCPEDVIHWSKDLGAYGTPTVEVNPAGCTTCRTCADHCPDCAIDVDRTTPKAGVRTEGKSQEGVRSGINARVPGAN